MFLAHAYPHVRTDVILCLWVTPEVSYGDGAKPDYVVLTPNPCQRDVWIAPKIGSEKDGRDLNLFTKYFPRKEVSQSTG